MKRKIKLCGLSLILLLLSVVMGGCGSSKMKDGFYTAEMSEYSHGWMEYLCIMVKNDRIVYAEFNAKDASGYIKAWDNAYMQNMYTVQDTYPNAYTRAYVASLIETQDEAAVDTVSGATSSGSNFHRLAAACIEQAKKGDSTTAVVESEAH